MFNENIFRIKQQSWFDKEETDTNPTDNYISKTDHKSM